MKKLFRTLSGPVIPRTVYVKVGAAQILPGAEISVLNFGFEEPVLTDGAVLSVNDGAGCHAEEFRALGISYRCIPLSDNAPPREGDVEHCLDALPLAYDYVREELDRKRTVLVHCRSGKDRTGLFMCYFLIRESGISVREAMTAVKRARPIALTAEGWEDLARAVLKAGNNRRTG